jgi:tartrate-resistant acid phosphatase type 5
MEAEEEMLMAEHPLEEGLLSGPAAPRWSTQRFLRLLRPTGDSGAHQLLRKRLALYLLGAGLTLLVVTGAVVVSRSSSARDKEAAEHGSRTPAVPPPTGGGLPFSERRLKLENPELTFLVIGDWGRQGKYQDRQVGQAMGEVAQQSAASFVLSVGDNIYDSGLVNETDPWFEATFTDIYTHPVRLLAEMCCAAPLFFLTPFASQGLATLPWYTIMGNHEYYGNSSAELAPSLNAKDGRWHPVRSNLQTFHGRNGDVLLTLASVDTSPFLKKYRDDDLDWRGLTPVVLPGDTPVAGEGIDPAPNAEPLPPPSRLLRAARTRKFEQPTAEAWAAWGDAQLSQLEGWLAAAQSSSAWTFVTGHHPIESYSGKAYGPKDLAGFAALLAKYEIPMWFNGHNHNLQWIKKPGTATHFICSGAGSLVDPDVKDPKDGTLMYGYNGAGFVVVEMDFAQTVVTFVDTDARVLYEQAVSRSA